MEFACSPLVYVVSFKVLWPPPQSKCTYLGYKGSASKLTLAVKSSANSCSIQLVQVMPHLSAIDVKVQNCSCSLIQLTETRGPTHMFIEPSTKRFFERSYPKTCL